jgi:hypothetical protein
MPVAKPLKSSVKILLLRIDMETRRYPSMYARVIVRVKLRLKLLNFGRSCKALSSAS